MPLPGGAADKFGNRYEGLWTVACILDVACELARSLRLEPPGAEGDGAEFWLRRGEVTEYHQVKRQHAGQGHWTIPELGRAGVLSSFLSRLKSAGTECVFVSTESAGQLAELADRARRAASLEEFRLEFLAANQPNTHFAQLRCQWSDSTDGEVYAFLRRVHVRTVDEEFLRHTIETQLARLVEGNAANAVDVLAQFALDQIHAELGPNDIWRHLESRDHRRSRWSKDPHVVMAAHDTVDRYTAPLRAFAVGGVKISRSETQAIVHGLTQGVGPRTVLVSGEAGGGKSGIVLQVIDEIPNDWPVIAFRLDRLDPEAHPDAVGRQLGLPGSPANVLASVADGRPCLLVIDQLDAISLASGRHSDFFDCVDEIIRQGQVHPNVRVLLACRKFDLDNDHRLRRLTQDPDHTRVVEVSRLSEQTVRDTVSRLGLDPARLSPKQLQMLSLPLHLSLLAQVTDRAADRAVTFQTAKELFDHFWDRKQEMIRARIGRSVRWTPVIDRLCDEMSTRQLPSAPVHVVDEFAEDATAMASEHILVRDGARIAFFHESFFDYAFARRFAARGQALLPFLLEDEQGLFRRAQIRQILVYEREADRGRYVGNLKDILGSSQVRFHLKQVIFALFAQLPDPTTVERDVVVPLLADVADPRGPAAWQTLHGSLPWFHLLHDAGDLRQWLLSPDEAHVDRTTILLQGIQRQASDRVAELVEPFVGTSTAWNRRLLNLMQWADLGSGRHFFELFLRLLDAGHLDQARGPGAVNSDLWSLLSRLVDQHPDWSCEGIGHYLNRRLGLAIAAGIPNPFSGDSPYIQDRPHEGELFEKSARGAPAQFVAQVLPFVRQVLAATASRNGPQPWPDEVWRYHMSGGSYNLRSALLDGVETALRELAACSPEAFEPIRPRLEISPYETMQFLLVRAFAANGQRFADNAADYLLASPARFRTGYIDSSHWATRQLLEAITPHCSDDRLERLGRALLQYYPQYERTAAGRRHFGETQLLLLQAFAPVRRPASVGRRLRELERKFAGWSMMEPGPVTAQWVGPPIPRSAGERMTDEQWLSAITRYAQDEDFRRRGDRLVGGAYELAQLLEEQVKRDPGRFAALIHRFPDAADHSYFSAVLRGLAGSGLDPAILISACARCDRLPDRPYGREICDVLGKAADAALTLTALDMVAWYATEDPDPAPSSPPRVSTGDQNGGVDALNVGINTTRGNAAWAIAMLISDHAERITHFLPALWRLVQDPSEAVRACTATTLIAMLRHERDVAVHLFQKLCDLPEPDGLLGTRDVEQFLRFALQTHFPQLKPIVEEMIRASAPAVATTGARQACLASLTIEDAAPLAEAALSGTVAQRIGAAQVYAANLTTARFRRLCEQALSRLSMDEDAKVREEAGGFFRDLNGSELGDYRRLTHEFVRSAAFQVAQEDLLYALERTTVDVPELICAACERFLDLAGTEAGDIRTHGAAQSHSATKLIVRAYGQAGDPGLRARCLDVIDRMAEVSAYGLSDAIGLYER